jgi:hypothetical protein
MSNPIVETYSRPACQYDDDWGWWVRIEGHFVQMPITTKHRCDQEVKEALQNLSSQQGIPYTIHRLHVRLRRSIAKPRQ